MSLDFFDDYELDLECPECNFSLAFTLSKIGSTIVCPNCNTQITLESDSDETIHSLNESLSEIEDLFDTFKI
jgi:uncharacterized Zn finger protein (UPF0148 family)